MSLTIKFPWDSQPQDFVGINWENPITRGLRIAVFGGAFYNAVDGQVTNALRTGLGFRSSSLSSTYDEIGDTAEGCVIGEVIYTSNNGDYATLDSGFYNTASDNLSIGIGLWGVSNTLYATCRRNNAGVTGLKAISFPYRAVIACSGSIGGGATAYENGLSIGSVSTFGTYSKDSRRRYAASTSTSTGKESRWYAAFNRALSAAEIASLSANPWQLFEPRRILIPVSVAGGTSLNLDPGTLALAGTVTASGTLGVGVNLSASALSVSGTLSAAGDLAYYVPMLDVSAIPIALSGALTASGDVQIGTAFALSGGTVSVGGTLSASGDIQITSAVLLDIAASALSLAGTVTTYGDLQRDLNLSTSAITVSGALTTSGDIQIAEAITLDLVASPVAMTGTAAVAGTLNYGTSFNLACDPIIVSGVVSASGDLLASTGTSAQAVWDYVLSNGQTAGANVVAIRELLTDLHRIHGLELGTPLVVTQTARTAGAISQALAEASGTVTVTRS